MSILTRTTASSQRTPHGSTRSTARAFFDPTALLQSTSEFLENDEAATSLECRLLPSMLRDPGFRGLFAVMDVVRAWSRRGILPDSVLSDIPDASKASYFELPPRLLADQRLIDGLAWCLRTQDESVMLAFATDARTPLQLEALWIAEASVPIARALVPRPVVSYLLESTRSHADLLLLQHAEYECVMTSVLEGRALVVFERSAQESPSKGEASKAVCSRPDSLDG